MRAYLYLSIIIMLMGCLRTGADLEEERKRKEEARELRELREASEMIGDCRKESEACGNGFQCSLTI